MTEKIFKSFRRLTFAGAILILLALPVAAQRKERVIDSWKPLHYDVNLSFNEEMTEISSARTEISVEVLAQNLATVDLDFGEMTIDSVTVAGQTAQFLRAPEKLNVALPQTTKTDRRVKTPDSGLIGSLLAVVWFASQSHVPNLRSLEHILSPPHGQLSNLCYSCRGVPRSILK